MLWLAFLLADSVLFQNPDDLKMIKSKGLLQKENYGLINGSGVNLEEYQHCELEQKPVISMISRLTASKGVNEFIKAASIVKQNHPNATFNLIGPIDEDSGINKELLDEAVESNTTL